MMQTDWMFQNPVDFEHKKYVLLSYCKKLDEYLNENKIYPMFSELSLHMANIQTLIKENYILYTKKVFESPDDEIILKELLGKQRPFLSPEEMNNYQLILDFSAPKFFEYFSLFKTYWSLCYDNISIKLRKNKKNLGLNIGFLSYSEKNGDTYVWEYKIEKSESTIIDSRMTTRLIYQDKKGLLTLNQIIDKFGELPLNNSLPVFEGKAEEKYPINETFLPLFKRKVLSHIFQTATMEKIKENIEE